MEISHRITFGHKDKVDAAIDALNLKYKKNPLPGGGYLIHIDITESDTRWSQLAALAKEKGGTDFFDTIFTTEEIISADWVRLQPTFEQGYPQPEKKMAWEHIVYSNSCPKCGVGFTQIAPFHLSKEPHLGKYQFVSLYWTYALFCTGEVLEELKLHHIQGYEVWEAIIHKTGLPSQVVSQLVFPRIAETALADLDKLKPETCPECGIIKYAYHKRAYMHLKRDALPEDTDFLQTHEWFGSGHSGFREILVSNRVARLILDKHWKGVTLKPVKLV